MTNIQKKLEEEKKRKERVAKAKEQKGGSQGKQSSSSESSISGDSHSSIMESKYLTFKGFGYTPVNVLNLESDKLPPQSDSKKIEEKKETEAIFTIQTSTILNSIQELTPLIVNYIIHFTQRFNFSLLVINLKMGEFLPRSA